MDSVHLLLIMDWGPPGGLPAQPYMFGGASGQPGKGWMVCPIVPRVF